MAKKFWLFSLLILLCLISSPVFAVSCNNGTITSQYLLNNTWTTFNNSFNLSSSSPVSSVRIAHVNNNIKNNNLWYMGKITLESTFTGGVNSNPTIVYRYGTTSSYIDISSYCTTSIKRTNYSELFVTSWDINYTCNYQGSNTSANWLQVYINTSSLFINKGNVANICLQISPNDKDQIINNDNMNTAELSSQIYEDYLSLWDKGDEIEEVVRYESSQIMESLEVIPHDQFVLDSSTAESVEQKEGTLRQGLLDPYQDGNLNSYISSGPNTTEYNNGMSYFWSIITRLIGPNSVLWILTSMILTLGIIRLVLSR